MIITPQIAVKYGNSDSVYELTWVSSITTTGATPTIYFSIPISQNKDITLYLNIKGRKIDFTLKSGGYIISEFIRGTGNLLKMGDIINIVTGFSGQKPNIVTNANINTQSIDIIVTGIINTSILWSANYYLTYNP